MNRSWPSASCVARSKAARQLRGLSSGNKPSKSSSSPTLPGQRRAGAGAGVPLPRIDSKNSLLGSTTIRSERLRKLAR
jgi:hypothetical protein